MVGLGLLALPPRLLDTDRFVTTDELFLLGRSAAFGRAVQTGRFAETFQTMTRLLGPLHEESYAHVHEVRGDAYGFGGLTQERRYIAGKLEIAPQQAAA